MLLRLIGVTCAEAPDPVIARRKHRCTEGDVVNLGFVLKVVESQGEQRADFARGAEPLAAVSLDCLAQVLRGRAAASPRSNSATASLLAGGRSKKFFQQLELKTLHRVSARNRGDPGRHRCLLRLQRQNRRATVPGKPASTTRRRRLGSESRKFGSRKTASCSSPSWRPSPPWEAAGAG